MVRKNQLIFFLSGTVFDWNMVQISVDKYIVIVSGSDSDSEPVKYFV